MNVNLSRAIRKKIANSLSFFITIVISSIISFSCSKNVPQPTPPPVRLSITDIHPINGKTQITDTIAGTGFDNNIKNDNVYFNGVAAKIVSASITQLILQVPVTATTGNVSVSVNGSTANGPVFTVLDSNVVNSPVITSISPTHGLPQSTDTIFGSGFSATPSSNLVLFNGVSASILTASTNRLIVAVPTATTGYITVDVNGINANGPLYTYDTTASDSVPKSHSDSLAFITNNWTSYQDSVSSINYGNSYGAPISGVLYNPPSDYWNFLSNGNIAIVLEGTYYTTTYQFLIDNTILINGLPASLTKPCTITTLTSKPFIFTTTDTSSNGGTYYRRVWLKK